MSPVYEYRPAMRAPVPAHAGRSASEHPECRALHEGPDVDHAESTFGVEPVFDGARPYGDHGASETTVLDGSPAWVKLKARKMTRMHHRSAEERMVEQRNIDAVDEEADVRRGCSADEESRQAGHNRHDSGLGLHRAQRIAERSGQGARLLPRHRNGSERSPLTAHDDFFNRGFQSGRLGLGRLRRSTRLRRRFDARRRDRGLFLDTS